MATAQGAARVGRHVSYPALEALFDDEERTPARLCVYMALRPPYLSHAVPRDVKIEDVRRRARVNYPTTAKAVDWLIERGYLVVHSKDARGMRSMTLAYALPERQLLRGDHTSAA